MRQFKLVLLFQSNDADHNMPMWNECNQSLHTDK
jgi:hypothetical protein